MKIFLVLGSPNDERVLFDEDFIDGVTRWTLHKDARVGDRILFYFSAPVSSILAAGFVSSEPQYQPNPDENWYKHWLGEVSDLRATNQVRMRRLRELFPEWKQIFYLRQNARVPDDLVEPLLELLEI